MKLTYTEAIKIVKKELKKNNNLSLFCRENKINYQIASSIKNGSSRRKHPTIMKKILSIYGYKVKVIKEIYFELTS